MDLFQEQLKDSAPLAERLRPATMDDFVGQEGLINQHGFLFPLDPDTVLPSMIFWGPPGSGKTTLAHLLSHRIKAKFIFLSAVMVGSKEVKTLMEEAGENKAFHGRRSVVFLDEIHRFNKAQQDAFLPYLEKGIISLLGATTENPAFSLNPALISRVLVLKFQGHKAEDLLTILKRAMTKIPGVNSENIPHGVLNCIIQNAGRDARSALNILEQTIHALEKSGENSMTESAFEKLFPEKIQPYSKKENRYDMISVFHKSIRGSDSDAALYWLYRMLEGGEDEKYILRRMIRMAVEDIGLADPQALVQVNQAMEAFKHLGPPEGHLALAQAAVYLSIAPKSNALENAEGTVKETIFKEGPHEVPDAFKNAPTKLAKKLGHGKGYAYDHHFPYHYAGQNHLPDALRAKVFYRPGELGFEKEIQKRMAFWQSLKDQI